MINVIRESDGFIWQQHSQRQERDSFVEHWLKADDKLTIISCSSYTTHNCMINVHITDQTCFSPLYTSFRFFCVSKTHFVSKAWTNEPMDYGLNVCLFLSFSFWRQKVDPYQVFLSLTFDKWKLLDMRVKQVLLQAAFTRRQESSRN